MPGILPGIWYIPDIPNVSAILQLRSFVGEYLLKGYEGFFSRPPFFYICPNFM